MDTFSYINAIPPEISQLLDEVKSKKVSDIIDGEGNQYVDLVMEGGGMLGIALVGYTYALERAGIRFLRIGGASAGAINALLLAAVDIPSKPKSMLILELMAGKNYYDFVDGDSDARDFVDAVVTAASLPILLWKGAQVIDNLNNDLGLNPGEKFRAWLQEILVNHQVPDLRALNARLRNLPPLKLRDGTVLTQEEADPRLAIIAAEISTETKVEFPKMADMFWDNCETVSPAEFVRCSMSIPIFFHPYRVMIPNNPAFQELWHKAGLSDVPAAATFVDGGIMSNFPIGIFHDESLPEDVGSSDTVVPIAPTFGVKLGNYHRQPAKVETPKALLIGIFNSARHTLDYEFITQHPEYSQLVAYVGVEQEFNWLDFSMDESTQIELFVRGVSCAAEFLRTFDWVKYKEYCKAYRHPRVRNSRLYVHKSDTQA